MVIEKKLSALFTSNKKAVPLGLGFLLLSNPLSSSSFPPSLLPLSCCSPASAPFLNPAPSGILSEWQRCKQEGELSLPFDSCFYPGLVNLSTNSWRWQLHGWQATADFGQLMTQEDNQTNKRSNTERLSPWSLKEGHREAAKVHFCRGGWQWWKNVDPNNFSI